MRICSGAGCLAKVPDDVRFCADCQPRAKADGDGIRSNIPAGKAGPSAADGLKLSGAQRAYTDEIQREYQRRQWREVTRRTVLQKNPFCVDCNSAPSTVADHVVPARVVVEFCRREKIFPLQNPPGFHLLANLVGRCHSCHNRKTADEVGKDWTEALEKLLGKYRGMNWLV